MDVNASLSFLKLCWHPSDHFQSVSLVCDLKDHLDVLAMEQTSGNNYNS